MNERIKELIESLGIIPEDEHYQIAELIIAECIKKVELRKEFAIEDEHNVDEAFSLLVYDIEEYFGVDR